MHAQITLSPNWSKPRKLKEYNWGLDVNSRDWLGNNDDDKH